MMARRIAGWRGNQPLSPSSPQYQPSNAEGGRYCDEESGIPSGSACTWVATSAYRNAGRERAPRNGTIGKVSLVSCVAGSFRLQLARVKPAQDTAKVVRNGPVIRYAADPRELDQDQDTTAAARTAPTTSSRPST
jgi:hypothetical protein